MWDATVQLLDDHVNINRVEEGSNRLNNDDTRMDHSDPMGRIDPPIYDEGQGVNNEQPNVYNEGLGGIGDNDSVDTDGVSPVANSPTAPDKHAHEEAPILESDAAQPDIGQTTPPPQGNLADLSHPLWEGCTLTCGAYTLGMCKIKTDHNILEAAMNELYRLVSRGLPQGHETIKTSYAAKKTLCMGLEYMNYDACPNHCILYCDKQYSPLMQCPICHMSGYRPNTKTPIQVKLFLTNAAMD